MIFASFKENELSFGRKSSILYDNKGDLISFGAIIRNDAVSSGGARGAASKTLSKYGLAIKISTDGYVELYVDGEKIFAIK